MITIVYDEGKVTWEKLIVIMADSWGSHGGEVVDVRFGR